MFLLTNTKEVMGILLDKKIKKSSLIFEESDDILKDASSIKQIKILYTIKKINKQKNISRVEEEKRIYINNYFKKIDKLKDEYVLKYLYYELFNKEEANIDIVYKELLNTEINKLYNGIKKTNIELKKLSF